MYPQPRAGTELDIRNRPVEFSYWPTRRGDRRHGIQSRIFASDPWTVIEAAIRNRTNQTYQPRALSALEQANDFFNASLLGTVRAARPLLLYYCFMNVVKAFTIMMGRETEFDNSHHGLSSDFPQRHANMLSGSLKCFPNQAGNPRRVNVYDFLHEHLTGHSLNHGNPNQNSQQRVIGLRELIPQILLGHRLWTSAASRKERFIEIDKIKLLDHRDTNECWMTLEFLTSEFTRHGYTHKTFFEGAGLDVGWVRTEFLPNERVDEKARLRIELSNPVNYGHRPSDVLNNMIASHRHCFWRSITTQKPFRKYYVYVAGNNDWVLPQVCSVYMLMFYLGSVTRYRPEQFDTLAQGKYGSFFQEFIENQPRQWLYMMASEFAEQEVTHAAVV
ncbi:MAG: hypothetical protein JJ973_00825 [Rhodospirillales bacterium]|nr:hypothetical protein [Rhodospirillales bacterium]